MGEQTTYVLEKALDLACRELACNDTSVANERKVSFLRQAQKTEACTSLKPAADCAQAAPSNDPRRTPGSSPPAS